MQSLIQEIPIEHTTVRLFIKRDDLIHPIVSGNKIRKLHYNISHAIEKQYQTILTFGGAFSNHILAVAYAGKEARLKTIGCIRGEEISQRWHENPTLVEAHALGMSFVFLTREEYRKKEQGAIVSSLLQNDATIYLIPEGGTNELAVRGCEEILNYETDQFDYITVAVGTGGTISGLINSSKSHQKVLGFPALKGDFLNEDIRKFAKAKNWQLLTEYHFGGYGRYDANLIAFINDFYRNYEIPLDPIYTGKMVVGVMDLIHKRFFPDHSKIVMIHTGGIQGIRGVNQILKQTNQPIISYAE